MVVLFEKRQAGRVHGDERVGEVEGTDATDVLAAVAAGDNLDRVLASGDGLGHGGAAEGVEGDVGDREGLEDEGPEFCLWSAPRSLNGVDSLLLPTSAS